MPHQKGIKLEQKREVEKARTECTAKDMVHKGETRGQDRDSLF